ncbi:hypothetical protein CEXT_515261 [Caerostris extrusa]|uniref:Laminin G domain-containing protein n=1 Tax=Caerostris extrusa TaxID=172846 RepID=A0AAV4NUG7_CAEEX|nr:hypothetical protein CEXT_515261 [Caerostris extrusa]
MGPSDGPRDLVPRSPQVQGPALRTALPVPQRGGLHPAAQCAPVQVPPLFLGVQVRKRIAKEDLERPVAFGGTDFLSFSNKQIVKTEGQRETNIEVTFRTSHHKGLLLWTNKGATIRGDYLALAISKGFAQLSFNLGKQKEPSPHHQPS